MKVKTIWLGQRNIADRSIAGRSFLFKAFSRNLVRHKRGDDLSFDAMDRFKLKICTGKWVYVDDYR